MKSKKIPYKYMVKDNKTLAEFGPVELGEGYIFKVRIKTFKLLDKDGKEYNRGPCISLQIYKANHFLKAISIPNGKEQEINTLINQACNYITSSHYVPYNK